MAETNAESKRQNTPWDREGDGKGTASAANRRPPPQYRAGFHGHSPAWSAVFEVGATVSPFCK